MKDDEITSFEFLGTSNFLRTSILSSVIDFLHTLSLSFDLLNWLMKSEDEGKTSFPVSIVVVFLFSSVSPFFSSCSTISFSLVRHRSTSVDLLTLALFSIDNVPNEIKWRKKFFSPESFYSNTIEKKNEWICSKYKDIDIVFEKQDKFSAFYQFSNEGQMIKKFISNDHLHIYSLCVFFSSQFDTYRVTHWESSTRKLC